MSAIINGASIAEALLNEKKSERSSELGTTLHGMIRHEIKNRNYVRAKELIEQHLDNERNQKEEHYEYVPSEESSLISQVSKASSGNVKVRNQI